MSLVTGYSHSNGDGVRKTLMFSRNYRCSSLSKNAGNLPAKYRTNTIT